MRIFAIIIHVVWGLMMLPATLFSSDVYVTKSDVLIGEPSTGEIIAALHNSRHANTVFSDSALFPALGFDGMPNQVALGFDGVGGRFYTIQQPESSVRYGLHARGMQPRADWLLYGSMSVHQQQDTAVEWVAQSSMLLNQPYQWADSSAADWTRRGVQLSGALLTPQFRSSGWRGALKLYHLVEQGATRQDPRPLYRHARYGIRLGMNTSSEPQGTIGWFIGYSNAVEESEIGVFSTTNPRVFYIRGLATVSVANVVRATRNWSESRYETGFSLRKNNLQASVELRYNEQDNQDGIGSPVFAGSLRRFELAADGRIGLRTSSSLHLHSQLAYSEGTDPLFGQVNVNMMGLNNVMTYHRRFEQTRYLRSFSVTTGHRLITNEDIVGFASYDIHHLLYGFYAVLDSFETNSDLNLTLGVSGSEKVHGEYIRQRENFFTRAVSDHQVAYMMASFMELKLLASYTTVFATQTVQFQVGGRHAIVTRSDTLNSVSRTYLSGRVTLLF
ncbi:MAG: hypothetical protein HLUCCA01_04185 [Bacteroidetes bacterium HLUCCA01]|nr:MAG: hypothetical protein HLUCCA01_04185 [Bacteroidetes bacterium HLUCCA01]